MTYRILIADDEANHRRCLSISLRMEGYDVLEASDGQHALEQLSRMPIHVVVCDLMMPRVDGLELARRTKLSYPDTGIVLMSAYHLTRSQLERAQVGDIRFLPKPYAFPELMSHLGDCIACTGRTARRESYAAL